MSLRTGTEQVHVREHEQNGHENANGDGDRTGRENANRYRKGMRTQTEWVRNGYNKQIRNGNGLHKRKKSIL